MSRSWHCFVLNEDEVFCTHPECDPVTRLEKSEARVAELGKLADQHERTAADLADELERKKEGEKILLGALNVKEQERRAHRDALQAWADKYAVAKPTGKYFKRREADLWEACIALGLRVPLVAGPGEETDSVGTAPDEKASEERRCNRGEVASEAPAVASAPAGVGHRSSEAKPHPLVPSPEEQVEILRGAHAAEIAKLKAEVDSLRSNEAKRCRGCNATYPNDKPCIGLGTHDWSPPPSPMVPLDDVCAALGWSRVPAHDALTEIRLMSEAHRAALRSDKASSTIVNVKGALWSARAHCLNGSEGCENIGLMGEDWCPACRVIHDVELQLTDVRVEYPTIREKNLAQALGSLGYGDRIEEWAANPPSWPGANRSDTPIPKPKARKARVNEPCKLACSDCETYCDCAANPSETVNAEDGKVTR